MEERKPDRLACPGFPGPEGRRPTPDFCRDLQEKREWRRRAQLNRAESWLLVVVTLVCRETVRLRAHILVRLRERETIGTFTSFRNRREVPRSKDWKPIEPITSQREGPPWSRGGKWAAPPASLLLAQTRLSKYLQVYWMCTHAPASKHPHYIHTYTPTYSPTYHTYLRGCQDRQLSSSFPPRHRTSIGHAGIRMGWRCRRSSEVCDCLPASLPAEPASKTLRCRGWNIGLGLSAPTVKPGPWMRRMQDVFLC